MTKPQPPSGIPAGGPPRGRLPLAARVAERRARWADDSSRVGDADRAGIDGAGIDGAAARTDRRADDASVAGPILAATATFATTSVIAMLAIALLPTAIFGWAATVIESSSMQPTVVRGDIVILRPPDGRAVVGEVVRFPADDGGTAIVHRVVAIDEEAGAYVTRGDANESDDRALVPFADVDGHGAMLVPLVGHPSLWVREGRYLTMGLFVLAGLGVIGAGNSIGRSNAEGSTGRGNAVGGADPSVDSDVGPIVPDTPLGPWAARPSDHRTVAVVTAPAGGDHPGRDRPGPP